MPLNPNDLNAHIAKWEAKLDRPYFSHRKHWPSRLFHHSPVENAVQILIEGVVRSRADPANAIVRDVAGEGVIDARVDAHDFVRLYFRPRTPTQFHIEGIRKADECEFGFQAPILIMFVFHARPILTLPQTRFSNGNMQKNATEVGDTLEFWNSIDWDKVYHEGGLGGDYSIIACRCAETLVESPLPLNDCLQWIYCRSEAERDTLLFMLGANAEQWQARIRVSDDIRVFNRLLAYVEHVHLSANGVIVELHPRNDGRTINFRLHVINQNGVVIAEFQNEDFAPIPPGAKRWRIPCDLLPGNHQIRIWIEHELAFEALLQLGDDLV